MGNGRRAVGEGLTVGRMAAVVATALAMALTGSPAAAEHMVDTGWIHGGVSSEDEARAYPCATGPLGGWERTGPVVCLEKQSTTWRLEASPEGSGCTYGPAGWHGSCVFDVDAGDHIRVWGTRGIGWTPFSVTWLHSGGEPDATPSPSPTSSASPSPDTPASVSATPSPSPAASPAPPADSSGAQSRDREPPATNSLAHRSPAATETRAPSPEPTQWDLAAPLDDDDPAAGPDRVTPQPAGWRAIRGGAILLLLAAGAMTIRILVRRRSA
jgi:hypothetical protein